MVNTEKSWQMRQKAYLLLRLEWKTTSPQSNINIHTIHKGRVMENILATKEAIYGSYKDQVGTIAKIVEALDELRREVRTSGEGLKPEEKVEYTLIALKLARTVTSRDAETVDSWFDLANYARLTCKRRTGVDFFDKNKEHCLAEDISQQ